MGGLAQPWSVAFVRTVAFGTLAGVHLPSGPDEPPADVLSRLHPQEVAFAHSLRGFRRVEWVGGRLAWAAAFSSHSQGARPALLRAETGAPLAPPGLSVSLTHKRELASALVADLASGTVGLDLEDLVRDRSVVAPKVLRPSELEEVDALAPAQRWPSVCARFALKEATYKAIFPHVQRYVSFHEASATVTPPSVVFHPRAGEPRLELTAELERLGTIGSPDEQLLALVRALPA